MRRQGGHVVVVVIGLVLALSGGLGRAQEAGLLKPCVLVLPLQTGPNAPVEAVAVSWAVHNVLENVLALHSTLEECWSTWFLHQVFPQQQDLQAWIQGQGNVPTAAIKALGVRYLITGQVQQQDKAFQVMLMLRDRTSDHTWSADLGVDLPGLVALRQGFLALLARAGIPAPAAQKAQMLWAEELPLAAWLLMGYGLETYVSALHYDTEPAVYNPRPFAEGVRLAPRSYLLLNNLGWVLLKQNKDAEAKTRFEQALALHASGVDAADGLIRYGINTGDATLAEMWATRKAQMQGKDTRTALADLHASWATRLENRYAYHEAIAHYQAAFAIDQMYRRREAAIVLTKLGEVYRALSQYAQALASYEQALVMQREVGDRAGEGRTLINLGEAYQALSQYAQALASYEQALVMQREVGDRAGEGTTLTNLGGVYDALSQYAQALASYEQALVIQREVGDRAGEGATLSNLGGVYDALSQYAQALASYNQALVIRREVRDRAGEGTTLANLGAVYWAQSQYAQAITYYEQALAIQREVRDRAGEGTTLNNLGEAYRAQSQYAQAITYYEQALAIQREVRDRAGEGTTLNNLGGVYDALSQYSQALAAYNQALVIRREVGDRAGEGATLNNLGGVYDALSQYSQALAAYNQALVIRREVGDRAGEGATLNNLGEVYRLLRQYTQALTYYEQALAIARAVGNRAGEGATLNNLGEVYRLLRQYTQALTYYEQALAIAREVGNQAGEATTLHNLMVVWQAKQHPQLAILYGKQAVNMLQSIRRGLQPLDMALQQGYLTAKEDTYRTLATLLITASRLPEAQQVLAMLKEEEYFEFTRRAIGDASTLTSRATLTSEETALETAYTSLADQITLLGKQYGELSRKKERTDEEKQQLNKLRKQLAVATDHFQKFLDQLQVKLGTSSAQGAHIAAVKELRAIRDILHELGEGAVLLDTLVGEDKYYVMLITPDTAQAYEHPITAVELQRKVLAFREVLQDPRSDPVPRARELYDILVGPQLAHDLQQAGAKTLMWSLDGVLRYLPIAALRDEQQQYLVETYRNVIVTLASLIRLTKPVAAHWQGLGLGVSKGQNVVLSDTNRRLTFNPLPGVRQELHSIIRDSAVDQAVAGAGVFAGRVLLDDNFTKDALQDALLEQYPLVHIASHFVFQPGNETNSFLLLGDPDEQNNKLTIAELKRVPFEGVALLTLSACETAMSGEKANGVEVESFGVLAQRQGAQAVLATLWPVADMSTPLLMREFYRLREAQPGITKAEAIRRAQLALLTEEIKPISAGKATRDLLLPSAPTKASFVPASFAHPFYWAPFILIGNWK